MTTRSRGLGRRKTVELRECFRILAALFPNRRRAMRTGIAPKNVARSTCDRAYSKSNGHGRPITTT